MKKLIILLMSLLLTFCICSLSSCEQKRVEKDGLIFEKYPYTIVRVDGTRIDGYEVTGCYEKLTTINIPSYINDKPIVSIKQGAFADNADIKEIIIPPTIERDTYGAFVGCNNVEKLTTPDPDFSGIFGRSVPSSLKYLYLTSDCSKINTEDFADCYSLLEVHIPKSVVTIDDGTNYTYIGVNGHTPPGKFDNLPFKGCNPELKIYCEAESKPNGWGLYWNYINDWQKATVYWGDDTPDTNQEKTPVLKYLATINSSTVGNNYSWGSTLKTSKEGIVINLEKNNCGFYWDLSNVKFKSNTKYVVKFENVSLSDISNDGARLMVRWLDSTYNSNKSIMYYHVKGQRFDIVSSSSIPDSYYQNLTQKKYDNYTIEFELIHSGVDESTTNMLYFYFWGVEKQLSIKNIYLYEITYE